MKRTLLSISALFLAAATFAQPTNGLVSEYNFNNGTAEDAVGGADGVLEQAVLTSDRFGNLSAMELNGSTARIYVPAPAHDFSEVTTLSMWVYIDNSASYGNHQLFDTRGYDFGAVSSVGWIDRDNNNVEFGTPGGGVNQYNQTIATDVWHHLVMTMDSDNDQILFYVNGAEVTDLAVAGTFIDPDYQNDTLYFGVRSDLAQSTHFEGKMDDIKIYDRVLTGSEVLQLYNDNSFAGVVSNGLVSRYTFSGNTNDDIGGAHATNNGAYETFDRFMNNASAFWLDGSNNSYLWVANPVHNFSQTTTISMWVRISQNADYGNHQLFDTRDPGFNFPSFVGWIDRANDRVEFGIPGGGITQFQAFIQHSEWTHLVMVQDNQNQERRFYRNGVEITNAPVPGTWVTPNYGGDAMRIGIRADLDGVSPFNGEIDDIRIYDRALNETEADSLYHEGGYMSVVTSITSSAEEDAVSIYPNPTNGTVYFGNMNHEDVSAVNVYSISGSLMRSQSAQTAQMDISDLPKGMYLVEVLMKDGTRSIARVVRE